MRFHAEPRLVTHEFARADRRGVAVRQRPAAHRPRLRLRCALRRLLPLPADGGRRGADGLRHGRARHADPGAGRRGGAHPARARRQVQPRDRERPAGPRARYDLFTRTTTSNHYAVVQELLLALHDNGYVVAQTAMGAISPSTGRTLPDRYIEGTCPICGYDGARGDQCDNCGNQLDPVDLINPRSRINGETPKFVETEHFFLDLPALAGSLGQVAVHPHRLAPQRAEVQPEPAGGSPAAGDHARPRLGRAGTARRLARPADEAALRLVRRRHRLPVGVGRVGAARPRPGRVEAVVDRSGRPRLLLHGQGQHRLPLGDLARDPARPQRGGRSWRHVGPFGTLEPAGRDRVERVPDDERLEVLHQPRHGHLRRRLPARVRARRLALLHLPSPARRTRTPTSPGTSSCAAPTSSWPTSGATWSTARSPWRTRTTGPSRRRRAPRC